MVPDKCTLLWCTILFSFVQFGQPQNQCVVEVRSLKADVQIDLGNNIHDSIDGSGSCLLEDDIRALEQNLTVGNQIVMDALAQLASKYNDTFEDFRHLMNGTTTKKNFEEMVEDKATKEDVLALQRVLKQEMQDVIRLEVQSVVRAEIESLTRHVVYIQNSMVQLLQRLYYAVPSATTSPPPATVPNSVELQSTKVPEEDTTDDGDTTAALPAGEQSDETLYTCNGTSGWKRVAFLDMNDTSYDCPSGLQLTDYSKRTCGRTNQNRGCSTTTFSVGGSEYSQVCGRIKAYQWGYGWGLHNYYQSNQGLDGHYLDGLSLTHICKYSRKRQHIWSFIAAMYTHSSYGQYECPCDVDYAYSLPDFMDNNYFCESATRHLVSFKKDFFPDNPLWDGEDCGDCTNTCCQVNNPPWFTMTLPNPTENDLELRMCSYGGLGYTDIPIEVIELYVK